MVTGTCFALVPAVGGVGDKPAAERGQGIGGERRSSVNDEEIPRNTIYTLAGSHFKKQMVVPSVVSYAA